MRAVRAVTTLVASVLILTARLALAQDNYEIQIYGSELVPTGHTMLELHSNYTIHGQSEISDGVSPSNHAVHETVEVTHGFTPWLEVGFYLFTTIQSDGDWNWVGNHVRPRVTAPREWHWPVGASLSLEVGYQRRAFDVDPWTLEIRPIVDKQWGRWYGAFNPVLDLAFQGQDASRGLAFSPNIGVTYAVTTAFDTGIEYYGSFGALSGFDSLNQQQHQLFLALNLNSVPRFELNAGIGVGLTAATDRLIFKIITGYRF